MSTQIMPLRMPRSRVKALSPWGISVLAHAVLVAMIFGSSKRPVPDAAPAPLPIAVQIAVAPQPQAAPAHVAPTPPAPSTPPAPPKPQRAPVATPRHVAAAAPAPAQREIKRASPAPGDAAPAPAAREAPSAPSTLAAAAPTPAPAPAQESLTPPIGNAAYLHNPAPKYPPSALEDGLEGRVVLRVHVDANGHPISVEVRTGTGHDVLDKAALAAVRRWTFVPAKRGATPVDGWVDIPLEFHAN